MKKIKCSCGTDITTMANCLKEYMSYICRECGKDITRKKFKQLLADISNLMKEKKSGE